jgi:hypothetical protein
MTNVILRLVHEKTISGLEKNACDGMDGTSDEWIWIWKYTSDEVIDDLLVIEGLREDGSSRDSIHITRRS